MRYSVGEHKLSELGHEKTNSELANSNIGIFSAANFIMRTALQINSVKIHYYFIDSLS